MFRLILGIVLVGFGLIMTTMGALELLGVITTDRPEGASAAVVVGPVVFVLPGILLIVWGRRARRQTGLRSQAAQKMVEEQAERLAQVRTLQAKAAARAMAQALEKRDYGRALDLGLRGLVEAGGGKPGILLAGLLKTGRFWSSLADAVVKISDLAEHAGNLYPATSRQSVDFEVHSIDLRVAMDSENWPRVAVTVGLLVEDLWNCRLRGDKQISDANLQPFFARWREPYVLYLLRAALMDFSGATEGRPEALEVLEPLPAAADTSIRFPCPRCARELRIKAELAGKRVKCPACKQLVQAPAGSPRASGG